MPLKKRSNKRNLVQSAADSMYGVQQRKTPFYGTNLASCFCLGCFMIADRTWKQCQKDNRFVM